MAGSWLPTRVNFPIRQRGRIEFKAIWRLLLLQFCDQLKMAVFMSMLIVVFVFLFFYRRFPLAIDGVAKCARVTNRQLIN